MKRGKFSREFKLEAVRLVKERGVAVAQAARDLDLHENVRASGYVIYRPIRSMRFPATANWAPYRSNCETPRVRNGTAKKMSDASWLAVPLRRIDNVAANPVGRTDAGWNGRAAFASKHANK
jgi:transposase